MQSTTFRVGAVVALIAAAVVLFVVLSDDDGDSEQAATTTTPATESGGNDQEPSEPKPPVATIVIRNGEPVAGIQELEYTKGDEVRLKLKSDVADEVHVHGYNLIQNVEPGPPITLGFPADIEGVFEVELEGAHVQIAELTVEPG